jgi:hypothetical protein
MGILGDVPNERRALETLVRELTAQQQAHLEHYQAIDRDTREVLGWASDRLDGPELDTLAAIQKRCRLAIQGLMRAGVA